MAEFSSAHRRGFRWGWWGAAVTHLGGKMVRKSRTVNALASAVQVTLRSLSRLGYLLWLEATGLFFVAFAAIGGFAAWHEYSKHKTLSGRVGAAICFMLIFAWFGLSSFYRAHHPSEPKSGLLGAPDRQEASPEGGSHVGRDEDRNSSAR